METHHKEINGAKMVHNDPACHQSHYRWHANTRLGQAQLGLGLGLKIFDLNHFNGGLTKVLIFHWSLYEV